MKLLKMELTMNNNLFEINRRKIFLISYNNDLKGNKNNKSTLHPISKS